MNHRMLKGFQEVFLELEMGQFFLLQEPHSKLTKSIEGEEGNMRIVVTANLVEMFPKNIPKI